MAENQKPQKTREFGLSSLSVDNSTSVVILTLIITVLGLSAYRNMPKESFPEIVIPTVYVGTPYPGNSPVDMENLITRPIEKELKSINDIKDINSTSVQDFSSIVIEFNPGIEISKAIQDVKDAVDKAKSELPTDLDQDPNVLEVNTSDFPIMNVNISGDYSETELKKFGEYLEDEIEKLSEISSADLAGTVEREIQINADPYKMEAVGVSFNDIAQAVQTENVTISGGNIRTGDFQRSLRVDGEFDDPMDLEDIIVKTDNQKIVYLRDVAEVKDTYKERSSYARSKNLPVVTINVVKRSGENLLYAADKIKEIIDETKANRFPPDVEITITNDQSKQTRLQVSDLENSIIFGVILVVLVLMFFLGFRNALFVGIAIPLSMFISFLVLNAFGITLNLMVLFSLILALGMLVDNGIVVVENIYRLMSEGKSSTQAAKEGVGEVAWPIITSTATTLAAFLPLAFWQDTVGEFMKFLPITLIIVLSSSLFVALVINPVLTAMFMKIEDVSVNKPKQKSIIVAGVFLVLSTIFYLIGVTAIGTLMLVACILTLFNVFVLRKAIRWFQTVLLVKLENTYESSLKFALNGKKPYLFFGGTFLLLIFSLVLLGVRAPKVLFFPDNQPQLVNVFIEFPIGTDIEATNEFVDGMEDEMMEALSDYEGILESVISQVGEGTGDPMEGPSNQPTPHKAKITIGFVDYIDRQGINTNGAMEVIRDLAEKYPGVLITVDKQKNGPPTGKAVNLEFTGENYDQLIAYVNQTREYLNNQNIPGVEELKTDLSLGNPEVILNIDREKARRFGLSTSEIANDLRTALFGLEVSKYKEGEDDYPIQLRLKEGFRYDINTLVNKKIGFRDKFGEKREVPISAVAEIKYGSTYGSVKRKDLDKAVTIYSNVLDGYNATEVNAQIQAALRTYEVPDGISVKYTGEQEEQQKSMEFLMGALGVAVSLIFLIIVAQFNSVTTPFIIMASVVLSTIGVFLGLVIFNMDFVVIMTGIGIISLAGVVVNNAIVLIDYTNLVRERKREDLGLGPKDRLPFDLMIASIVESGKTRLRPVLLTAITTVLGLIPLAIGMNINFGSLLSDFDPQFYVGGDNAAFWGPMAWTVIFGLTFATFLTLVIVPVMYLLADKLSLRISKLKS
ncbi:efflux RND transporter permease subunit [Algoriphagus halophytocola]|uniref:Efflux RND transporter permease subunit n=1 Tax=Algoriphagus halophytocola TaxID=2991499 RepID=A0ABY6MFM5_9BACT|nr:MULTISPECIES: efflux RND transporter permease subunit [unclassified Algoriphagus]UZD22610.1 efflux RND transporter permease subunit [Algoriphagus sp. TR-M5]WBL43876.1 efflux RND transporter permease subunit [Algoriphagus sp. TR-M9]